MQKREHSITEPLSEKCPNTELFWSVFSCIRAEYEVNLRIQSEYRKVRTRKNSVFEHFSRSERLWLKILRMLLKMHHIHFGSFLLEFEKSPLLNLI